MTSHPFKLQGDEYWTDPFKNAMDLQDATIGEGKTALLIDAPPLVDSGIHQTIPVLVYTCMTQKDEFAMPLERGALLVATRLEDRETFTAAAVSQENPQPGGKQQFVPQEGVLATSSLSADLRKRLALDLSPATYMVTLLLRDRASNRVRVTVARPSAGYTDPEVEKVLGAPAPPPPAPVTPAPGSPLPSYAPVPTSPPVPATAGVALTAPRVFLTKDGTQAVVAGSFRVPVLQRERVTAGGPPVGAERAGKAPTAVVPVTLVVLSSETSAYGPYRMRMRVPSYDAIAGGAGAEVTGHFAVDLFSFAGLEKRAATCFVYAFVGEWMAGPVPVGVVTEKQLPK
jgi:hypothetical protein